MNTPRLQRSKPTAVEDMEAEATEEEVVAEEDTEEEVMAE